MDFEWIQFYLIGVATSRRSDGHEFVCRGHYIYFLLDYPVSDTNAESAIGSPTTSRSGNGILDPGCSHGVVHDSYPARQVRQAFITDGCRATKSGCVHQLSEDAETASLGNNIDGVTTCDIEDSSLRTDLNGVGHVRAGARKTRSSVYVVNGTFDLAIFTIQLAGVLPNGSGPIF
jgi:hypothetical protein